MRAILLAGILLSTLLNGWIVTEQNRLIADRLEDIKAILRARSRITVIVPKPQVGRIDEKGKRDT